MTDSNTNTASQQQRQMLAKLLLQKARGQAAMSPLSYGQQALWFLYQLDPYSPAYNLMYAAYVRPDLDRQAFSRAFQVLFVRHAILRTTYGARNGEPAQFVHPEREFTLDVVDAAAWSQQQLETELERQADIPFDLERGRVLRVYLYERDRGKHVLLITAHHIAMDFWAFDRLFDELEQLYRGATTGSSTQLPELKLSYIDYVHWQRELLAGKRGEQLYEYWRQQLGGDLPVLNLPTDYPRPPLQSFNGESYRFQLPDDLARQVMNLANEQGATLYATLLAAFYVLLHRYSGQQDIPVGSFTAGRGRVELEPVLGYFLNSIVLRAHLASDMPFRELLEQVRKTVLDGITHEECPFSLFVQRSQPARDPSRSPIFQVAFGLDRPRYLESKAGTAGHAGGGESLELEPFVFGQRGAPLDLLMTVLNVGNSLSGAVQFNTDLFRKDTIVRLVGHYEQVLHSVVADPDQALGDVRVLSDTEWETVLTQWNDTVAEYPADKCVHQLIEDQVAVTPESIAVTHGDRDLTYQELNEKANQLAHYLQELGVGPEGLVGISVERSPEMIVGLLGIFKAGGAYVPLAPGTPAQRLSYMLEESKARIVITESHLVEQFHGYSGTLICMDRDWLEIGRRGADSTASPANPDNLAYVMFTSGSTGKPKGVQIEHRSVVNFLTSMRREPGIAANDTLLAVTTLTFDISVLELFLPLIAGARVVIVDRDVAADGRQLKNMLVQSGTTIVQATPATWRLVIEAGWNGDQQLKALCGGEALPEDLAQQLLRRCGSLWNMYGPTETTIWSAVDNVSSEHKTVSIGRPISNTQIRILDSRLQPVPIGVPGHLYIGGAGLARGYLNQSELTAERFVADTLFGSEPGCANSRLYNTGDLARYQPDGRIQFLGRQDFQVKVRGFRIELGEIETALNEHATIQQAVVTTRQFGPRIDDKKLVAYVIPTDHGPVNTSELRAFLRERLPDYMVPATFVPLEQWPLNPAGKVDRNALPEPDATRPQLNTNYVSPSTPIENALAEIWMSVLGIDKVGVHDSFFDLGGASIESLEVAARAEQVGYQVAPAMIFQFPTIAELAATIGTSVAKASKASGDSPDGLEIPPPVDVQDNAARESRKPAGRPAPRATSRREIAKQNTIIESLGIYLPPNEVSTREVLAGCQKSMWFPLEKMTGIRSRHMAGETEFSADLAARAVEECLANSRFSADDIELVVCSNISHIDGDWLVSLEPNTSMQLKKMFGFPNAEVFDLANACGGVFTAISVVNAFIHCGIIQRGMVVSGEYITGITKTAQLEIEGFLDPQLASLTVGDAGAALILEAAPTNDVGFHEIEMYTLSKYSRMCIGRLTEEAHGGPIMLVPDPIAHTSVSVEHSVQHSQYMLERCGWPPEKLQLLIMHQTSDRSLRDGMRAINKSYRKKICHDGNTVRNVAVRGNTASTSHFVAVWDNVFNGKIKSGDNVVFGVTGSGQTIGTAVYTFDDLPDRLRDIKRTGTRPATVQTLPPEREAPLLGRVRIHRVATLPLAETHPRDTSELTTKVAELCLATSDYDRSDIQLLLFAGMLRTGYIQEPAIAALLAGDLKMNDIIDSQFDKKTFVFDIFNGAMGCLNACHVATRMIQAGTFDSAMILMSEVEVNSKFHPEDELGIAETASAMILEPCSDGAQGFGGFLFKYFTEHYDRRTAVCRYRDGKPLCDVQQDPAFHDCCLKIIPSVVDELLQTEGLSIEQIRAVMPPNLPSTFHVPLAEAIGIDHRHIFGCPEAERDLFTSVLPYSIERAMASSDIRPGDIGLIINVASGIQVGCAVYYF